MSEHALLSASSSHRWIACPGSVALCKDIPNTTSKYAEEGTRAHDLAAKKLLKQPFVCIEDEMLKEVDKYVSFVNHLATNGTLMVEKRVDYSRYIGVPNSFGTSDAIVVTDDGEEVICIDLKYGRGVTVDADENPQLMLYALGALDELSFVYPNIKRVRLIIHQPRLNHISEWDCTVERLLEFAKEAKKAAIIATNPTYTFTNSVVVSHPTDLHPGEEQCRFCPGKAICPALKDFVSDKTAEMFDIVSDEITPETLDLIEQWVSAKYTEYSDRLRKGEVLNYWKLVAGKKGNRAWKDKLEAETTLKAMRFKKEEMYDYSLISPTTAEELMKENPRKWSKVKDLIVQPDGKPTLVSIKDKKPALVMTKPEDGFDVINNEGEN